jgi:hypothetical protein
MHCAWCTFVIPNSTSTYARYNKDCNWKLGTIGYRAFAHTIWISSSQAEYTGQPSRCHVILHVFISFVCYGSGCICFLKNMPSRVNECEERCKGEVYWKKLIYWIVVQRQTRQKPDRAGYQESSEQKRADKRIRCINDSKQIGPEDGKVRTPTLCQSLPYLLQGCWKGAVPGGTWTQERR